MYKDPRWYDLVFDATGEKKGKVLLGYGVMDVEEADINAPDNSAIVPDSMPATLNVVLIGMRNLIPSINLIPLQRLSVELDIAGDT